MLVFPALFAAMWKELDNSDVPDDEKQWEAYEKSRQAKPLTRDERTKRQKKACEAAKTRISRCASLPSSVQGTSVPAMLDALAAELVRAEFDKRDKLSDADRTSLNALPGALQKQFKPWTLANDKLPDAQTEKGAYMALKLRWRSLDDVLMDGAERVAPSMDPDKSIQPPPKGNQISGVIQALHQWYTSNQVGEQSSLSFLAKASTTARGAWMRKPQVALKPEWWEVMDKRKLNGAVLLLAMRPAAHWHLSAFVERVSRRDLWPSQISSETRLKLQEAMRELEAAQSAAGNWFGLLVVSPQRLRVLYRRAERILRSKTPQEADSAPQEGETAEDEKKASGALARIRALPGTIGGKFREWGQSATQGWRPARRI